MKSEAVIAPPVALNALAPPNENDACPEERVENETVEPPPAFHVATAPEPADIATAEAPTAESVLRAIACPTKLAVLDPAAWSPPVLLATVNSIYLSLMISKTLLRGLIIALIFSACCCATTDKMIFAASAVVPAQAAAPVPVMDSVEAAVAAPTKFAVPAPSEFKSAALETPVLHTAAVVPPADITDEFIDCPTKAATDVPTAATTAGETAA